MLHNLSCPSCGGSLTGLGRKRLFSCRYCGGPLLLAGLEGRYLPRYLLAAIPKSRALASFKEMLRHSELPGDFNLRVKMRESTLYYVPFYELYGRRMGTRPVRSEGMDPDTGRPLPPRTEVLLGDFARYLPAISLPDWGVEHVDLLRQTTPAALALRPFDEGAASAQGAVLTPDVSTEKAASRLGGLAETAGEGVELAELRFSLIYYPVWLFRYEFRGKIYFVTVDGADGRLLRGRAPRDESRRVRAMLAVLALAAFPIAKTLRFAACGLTPGLKPADAETIFALSFFLMAGGLVFSLGVLAYGWNMFRFSQEMVFFPGGPDLRYIGKPPQTAFERAFDRVMGAVAEAVNRMFKPKPQSESPAMDLNIGRMFWASFQIGSRRKDGKP